MTKFFFVLICLLAIVPSANSQVEILDSIQGNWVCYRTGCQKTCEICCENEVYIDMQIVGDSVHIFDYPDTYFGSYHIKMLDDSLFCSNGANSNLGYARLLNNPKYKNDSLSTFDYYFFKRGDFDQRVLDILKTDSINTENLLGKWELVMKYDQYYMGDSQGDGYWHVELPFKINRWMSYKSKSKLPKGDKSRFMYLTVNGEMKPFYIVHLTSWRLTVIPLDWFESEYGNQARHEWTLYPVGNKFALDFEKIED